MFIPGKDICVLEIPKTGTNTVRTILEELTGRRFLPGHLTAEQVVRTIGRTPEFWALIRDPWDRFRSAMNFVYGDTGIALDDAMNGAARHGTIVFKAQADFVTDATRLWRFEDMPKMLAALGYTGPIPRRNASVRRWDMSEIRAHPMAEAIMERYAPDFELRDRI